MEKKANGKSCASAATAAEVQEPKKKVSKTWEAFGKSKGCFIINDPKFLL